MCERKINGFSRVVIKLIKFYQRWISPLKYPCCRFYPTCSEYAVLAIQKHGFIKGSLLFIKRILKCNALYPGGYDPVK